MNTQKTDCSYCGEFHPQHGDICPTYEQHKLDDCNDGSAKRDITDAELDTLDMPLVEFLPTL